MLTRYPYIVGPQSLHSSSEHNVVVYPVDIEAWSFVDSAINMITDENGVHRLCNEPYPTPWRRRSARRKRSTMPSLYKPTNSPTYKKRINDRIMRRYFMNVGGVASAPTRINPRAPGIRWRASHTVGVGQRVKYEDQLYLRKVLEFPLDEMFRLLLGDLEIPAAVTAPV